MRGFIIAILACFLAIVAAWSKEDQEIFRLQNEVATHEGSDVTFYSLLDIKPSASQEEIRAAYKKKSRTQHPDKVKAQFIADKSTGKGEKSKNKKPGVKVSKGPSQAEIKAHYQAASDRFTRLGLINKILLGEGRARYDHFLKNGFPKWKGTGYYYARFRPGFGSVLVGLFIFVGGGGHYVALYVSWKRQREFVERYITYARNAAWGGNLNVPGLDGTSTPGADADAGADAVAQPMNRRQRRMQEKDSKKDKSDKKVKNVKASAPGTPTSITGPKKRVVAENGRVLIVDSANNVYLEQPDEDGKMREFLLDLDELPTPTMRDTALFRLPLFAFNKTIGRVLSKTPIEEEYEEVEEAGSSNSDADDFEVLEKSKTPATNGNGKATRRNKKNVR
ncbi:hypothetical protein NHQ30_010435 [Ciborinia camelliae]|nr:hypothetical protein NHQ30_010435 [Ciborinia camelliae]